MHIKFFKTEIVLSLRSFFTFEVAVLSLVSFQNCINVSAECIWNVHPFRLRRLQNLPYCRFFFQFSLNCTFIFLTEMHTLKNLSVKFGFICFRWKWLQNRKVMLWTTSICRNLINSPYLLHLEGSYKLQHGDFHH